MAQRPSLNVLGRINHLCLLRMALPARRPNRATLKKLKSDFLGALRGISVLRVPRGGDYAQRVLYAMPDRPSTKCYAVAAVPVLAPAAIWRENEEPGCVVGRGRRRGR